MENITTEKFNPLVHSQPISEDEYSWSSLFVKMHEIIKNISFKPYEYMVTAYHQARGTKVTLHLSAEDKEVFHTFLVNVMRDAGWTVYEESDDRKTLAVVFTKGDHMINLRKQEDYAKIYSLCINQLSKNLSERATHD